MQSADLILATGGPGMVKAAYSSGKPALGVGPGNTPAVIDKSANIILAVNSIIHSKTFDNGMICASEQSVIVDQEIYEQVKTEFIKKRMSFLKCRRTRKSKKNNNNKWSTKCKNCGTTSMENSRISRYICTRRH